MIRMCTRAPQALELQYYEAIMGQLERAGQPAAAAALASAAVQHVDAAVGGGGAQPGEGPRREGRLWANLLEYALQGGAFEVRANKGTTGCLLSGSVPASA